MVISAVVSWLANDMICRTAASGLAAPLEVMTRGGTFPVVSAEAGGGVQVYMSMTVGGAEDSAPEGASKPNEDADESISMEWSCFLASASSLERDLMQMINTCQSFADQLAIIV